MQENTSTLIESRRRLIEQLTKPAHYSRLFPVLPKQQEVRDEEPEQQPTREPYDLRLCR